MLTRFRGKEKFRKADFQESNEDLNLPCCGWYHVYTFMAAPPADGKPVEEEIWLDEACREEQLALVLIDIGAFQNSPLSREALLHIGQILAFFHQIGKMVILRFVYDREGRGMQKEPFAIAMVKRHMEQAGEAIRPWLSGVGLWPIRRQGRSWRGGWHCIMTAYSVRLRIWEPMVPSPGQKREKQGAGVLERSWNGRAAFWTQFPTEARFSPASLFRAMNRLRCSWEICMSAI